MINMNDLMGAAKGMADKVGNDTVSNDNAQSGASDNDGLASLMAMAKDINMEELERYKNMPKMELLQELKNSEHSETVINFIKGLIAQKGG